MSLQCCWNIHRLFMPEHGCFVRLCGRLFSSIRSSFGITVARRVARWQQAQVWNFLTDRSRIYRRQYFLSLNQQGHFPDQIHGCKTEIRWLRANASQYGYGIDRIVVSGCSAGGQLAALVDADGLLDELFQESVVDFVADAAEAGELFFFGAFGVGGVVEGPVQSFDLAGECWAVVLGS